MLIKDIKYKDESFYVSENCNRCVLDIQALDEPKNAPVIVWFHGGGLTGGAKHTPPQLLKTPLQSTIVVAAGYRLAAQPDNMSAKECIDDATEAVAWVFKNIGKYGGDPTRVFVSGASAGAYLTMMLTMDPKRLRKFGCDYTQIKGIIPLSGQCITHFQIRAEQHIDILQPTIDEYAPLFFANTPNLPPILLVTGDKEMEMAGRTDENAYLRRMLILNGHQDVTHYEIQGYGHDMAEPAYRLATTFIDKISPPKRA